jgi:hypothetical protein
MSLGVDLHLTPPPQLLEDCNLCAIHAKRVTISEWLLQLASLTGGHASQLLYVGIQGRTNSPGNACLACSAQRHAASPAHSRPHQWRLLILIARLMSS